ncbi:hypothetical protein QVD17_20539 [Tagetes erecta]|uniref:Harbinger transposase-derived protein n=1 Tax=Tagetes erecta TaxID=13708 RepID=A0AAD8NXC2_TARER|nr:hypothetical protein QVD17_20539 [Tagetes erecta]
MLHPLLLEDSTTGSSSSSSGDSNEIRERNIGYILSVSNFLLSTDVRDTASSSRTYIRRDDRAESHDRLVADYFSENPKYNARMFRERFRMNRELFLKIVRDMENDNDYFRTRFDARHKTSFSSLQKCTSAIRQLGYGNVPDSLDEYLNMSDRTSRESLQEFCEGVIRLYGKEYLRRPTAHDITILYNHHATRHGFPGMLGSVDCTHWAWRNCPMAWRGQFMRGDHNCPTLILEAATSQDTWFWHAYFGMSGSNNDLNVLNQSPLFNNLSNGTAPIVPFTINGNEYKYGYYLVDGIYPRWSVFVKTIPHATGDKRKRFSGAQEAARKDVERAFGILKSRWGIVRLPARAWEENKIRKVMYACIILHNMILKDDGLALCPDYVPDPPAVVQDLEDVRMEIRDSGVHKNLLMDLVDYIEQAYIPRLDD